jgi:ParB family chromosome partitioning protein
MNLDLTGLAELALPAAGEPLMVLLDIISRDPDQPRKHFDEATLQELAESIRAIGVVQPISVRPDPAAPGRYIINYGERRYRASMIAGMQAIPAFLHKAPDDYTQVAENLHRDDLSPMEMALFIKRRLDAGEKKYEIAAKLGYKNGYVTEHLALLEAPPCVEKAYANGATSARTLYDLRRLYDEFPQEVDAWCASGAEVTRDSVAALVQKFRRDEILDDVPETQESSGSGEARDAEVTHDSVAAPVQKFRRDEILDVVTEMHVSSGLDVARDGAATRDSIATLAQKFRRDEILHDAPGTRASSCSAEARNVQVPRSVKQRVSLGPSVETRATSADCIGDKQAAVVSRTGRSPTRLLIRVQHDGRIATVQDESVVLLRYDDGCTAEVSLANTFVLGTAAE